MKNLKILILLLALLALVVFLEGKKHKLEIGDIAFVGYNSKYDDNFSLILLREIPPNTLIYFTDAEWNGNRFEINENDLIWNSGQQLLNSHTIITFENIKSKPKVNYGSAYGSMSLSEEGDAIFAYIGESIKQPIRFIAAVSNDSNEFGTLENTNLEEGKTAITYPQNTYSAIFAAPINYSKDSLLNDLNNFDNYNINTHNNRLAKK